MNKIDELRKKVNDLQADCNDLYAEVRHYEKLSDIEGMGSYSDEIRQFIDTYEMLKDNYFKGHVSEQLFFDALDDEVDHLRDIS